MHLPSLALRVFVLAAISAAASACKENYDCTDGKFCGTDSECHNLSCAEWYQYGVRLSQDPNMDESNIETLTCKDIDTTAPFSEVFHGSVSYRCVNRRHPPAIHTGFNRKCTAGDPTFDYTCYELSEGTQFLTFMSEVESAIQNDGMNCTEGEDPFYLYKYAHVEIEESPYKTHTDTIVGSLWFDRPAELDKVRATTGTLFSTYTKYINNPPRNTAPQLTASKEKKAKESKSGKKSKVPKSKKAKASKS